ncbi:MAG: CHAP domain-containing protein [Campylobacteraceae bacterium]|jgi:surface antigen|nr:CHAP domain-containing protein [Campylobacteraceae bacterium]
MRRLLYLIAGIFIAAFALFWVVTHINLNFSKKQGDIVDEMDGVAVYYNGAVESVEGRNTADDGYNIGLKYQCVEFVKRYYCEHLNHKMPDSYGHAKDFFDADIKDAEQNPKRALTQYKNPSATLPQKGDILVFKGTILNRYGHVAIISNVTGAQVEIIQQNPGQFGNSREWFALAEQDGKYFIENSRVLGWLRKEKQ